MSLDQRAVQLDVPDLLLVDLLDRVVALGRLGRERFGVLSTVGALLASLSAGERDLVPEVGVESRAVRLRVTAGRVPFVPAVGEQRGVGVVSRSVPILILVPKAKAVSRRRALMTDRERELIASDDLSEQEQEYRYQAASRIRNKIEDELTVDIEILREHHPQLLAELRDVVCEDGEGEEGR